MLYRILAGIILLLLAYQLVTHLYRDEEKEVRTNVRTAVKKAFPGHKDKYSETIGLFRYGQDSAALGKKDSSTDTVVLIHGLDDPGKVWQDLAPALIREGYDVWQFEYPNDQPLVESAAFFFQQLQLLTAEQIGQISIVAHSMGGLITREMLTSEDIDYRGSFTSGLVPRVAELIMVGTPNHGSHLLFHLQPLREGIGFGMPLRLNHVNQQRPSSHSAHSRAQGQASRRIE